MQSSAPLKSQQKWLEDCNGINIENFQWSAAYRLASKCTKSTKLIEFQFKLLHRRIPTNEFLVKIGIKDTPQCSFCKEEPEKLIHLFWLCPKTVSFWQSIITWLNHRTIIPDNYSIENIVALGLRPDSSKYHCQVNFCFLLPRHLQSKGKFASTERLHTIPKINLHYRGKSMQHSAKEMVSFG